MELFWAVVGAFLGILFERITSFFRSLLFSWRFRHIRGTYVHGGGEVNIKGTTGNQFVTEGNEIIEANSWEGSFHMEDMHMQTGRGAYRHRNRTDDWGFHNIMLLENGDISVQWENMSDGNRSRGALIWKKKRQTAS